MPLPCFPPSISHSTQVDLPQTPADPAQIPPNTAMDMEALGYVSPFDDFGCFSLPPPGSPQIDFSEINNFPAPADAPEDGRPWTWSTDADMPGVNDAAAPQPQAAAAPPVPVGGGGHAAPCCATGTTEIQPLDEEDAQRRLHSWKLSDVEQRPFAEVEPLTAPDEKLAPAPEDGRPSGRDADMAEVNATATQPIILDLLRLIRNSILCDRLSGGKVYKEEVQRRFDLWKRTVLQDLFPEVQPDGHSRTSFQKFNLEKLSWPDSKGVSTVRFTGPDSKGRKPHQAGWKEKSMKGMRAVADPSSPQPPGQQLYVGLKKTLELDDGGNGNKWRAHEYTPLLPSEDGSDKLTPAEISLRVEFKEDKREDEPPLAAAASSTKRKEDEPPSAAEAFTKRPKTAPKKSAVWDHMTKVHVKVAATTNKDGTQRRKNPHYKVMYAICHHCDQVFNADSNHGTHNLSNHLDICKDCKCTH